MSGGWQFRELVRRGPINESVKATPPPKRRRVALKISRHVVTDSDENHWKPE
jgi:hypothetical protein